MKERLIISLVALILVSGCYYDVEEVLYPPEGSCVEGQVSYVSQVEPILRENCYVCHGVGSTITTKILEGHDKLKPYAEDGTLVGVINHDVGFLPMPEGGAMLSDCKIETISTWVDQGAMNN